MTDRDHDDFATLEGMLGMLREDSSAGEAECQRRIATAKGLTPTTEAGIVAQEIAAILDSDMTTEDDIDLEKLVERGRSLCAGR